MRQLHLVVGVADPGHGGMTCQDGVVELFGRDRTGFQDVGAG